MDPRDLLYWKRRGLDDNERDRGALFRRKKGICYAVGEHNQAWTEEEENEVGEAYLSGYDS